MPRIVHTDECMKAQSLGSPKLVAALAHLEPAGMPHLGLDYQVAKLDGVEESFLEGSCKRPLPF